MSTYPAAERVRPAIEPRRGVYRPIADSYLLIDAFVDFGADVGVGVGAEAEVLDLCCGSGVIGVSAALLGHSVTAIDFAQVAVSSARRNAELNGVDLAVRRGDLFEPVAGRGFDAILCNPPYVPTPQTIGTRRHQWSDGGADGRELIDRICIACGEHLNVGGSLWLVQSSLASIGKSERLLALAGFDVEVVAEREEMYGPVNEARREYFAANGYAAPGDTSERLAVLRATRAQ